MATYRPIHLTSRINRPELWGPLTRTDLLNRLAVEHNWACSDAARWGKHPTNAYLTAWQSLRQEYGDGPFNPARLDFAARCAVGQVQTARFW
jgi:hypothetical protein